MADREFIAANALPVTEAEEVNVLVVDTATGELAQKAGAELSKTKYDLAVRITLTYDEESNDPICTPEIISGSYDAVMQKLNSETIPVVLVIEDGVCWGNEIRGVWECTPIWVKNSKADEYLDIRGPYNNYIFGSDGTILLD